MTNNLNPNTELTTSDNNLFIRIKNTHGSQDHYYHYLLGYLFPLINWYYFERPEWTKNKNIILSSCGDAMDPHTFSLNLSGVYVVNKLFHKESFKLSKYKIEINGYDWPFGYKFNREKILRVRNLLIEKAKLQYNLNKKQDWLLVSEPSVEEFNYQIQSPLMINRGAEHPSYHQNAKGSARSRRSIPNFLELVEILKHKNPRVEYLEHATLLDQIILFNTHNIIIAQHGAALTNIVFCEKNTKVIEIGPYLNLDCTSTKFPYFEKLGHIMRAKMFRCPQEMNHHYPINLDAFVKTLEEAKII